MKKLLIQTTLLATPVLAFAQTGSRSFQQIASDLIITGSNYALRLLVALTLFVFLYGLVKYLYKGQESDAARTEGRKLMLWGIIGLFVMTSIWAIVALLSSLLGHQGSAIPQFKSSAVQQNTSIQTTQTPTNQNVTGQINTNQFTTGSNSQTGTSEEANQAVLK